MTEQARKLMARKLTDAAFKGRRGHGGGECTKRVFTRTELEKVFEWILFLAENQR